MLPSLSTKRTLSLTVSILPKDNGNYDIIIRKDMMKSLSINANIVDGIFTWNKSAIPMVIKGHWTEKAINAFITHHFSKPTSTSAAPDNTAASTNQPLSPSQTAMLTKTQFAALSARIARTALFQRAWGRDQTIRTPA